ncbi:MAG TPA: diacylglycerol kinase [Opitutae bacterium]|nr:diacylglycerol kinase [Opitutae bacterium]
MKIVLLTKIREYFFKEKVVPKPKGIRGLFHKLRASLGYSLSGLKEVFASELSFRLEVALGVILIPLVLWMDDTPFQKLLLIGSYLFVLIVELLNTAIEELVNWMSPDKHVLAKKIKDAASAAVFLSICVLVLTWGQFFYYML